MAVVNPGESVKSCPERELTQKKVSVRVWSSNSDFIHYRFLRDNIARSVLPLIANHDGKVNH